MGGANAGDVSSLGPAKGRKGNWEQKVRLMEEAGVRNTLMQMQCCPAVGSTDWEERGTLWSSIPGGRLLRRYYREICFGNKMWFWMHTSALGQERGQGGGQGGGEEGDKGRQRATRSESACMREMMDVGTRKNGTRYRRQGSAYREIVFEALGSARCMCFRFFCGFVNFKGGRAAENVIDREWRTWDDGPRRCCDD